MTVLPLVSPLLAALGAAQIAVSAAFFWAPAWSFEHVARFAPYNPHLLADIGAFGLPLGVGLLIAARDPRRHALIVALAALGNLAHAASHLRDLPLHLPPHMALGPGLLTEASTLLAGVVLSLVAVVLRRPSLPFLGGAR